MSFGFGIFSTSGDSNNIMVEKKKKKKKVFAGGSITDEVRAATGIGGATSAQKSERFLKSQGRDPSSNKGSDND